MTRLPCILAVSLVLGGGTMFSQGVEWSLFPSGFALSQSASNTVVSSVGEPFIGFSQMGSTSILSGSLTRNNVILTEVKEGRGRIPLDFALYQNYPNPFNPSTTVRYDLPTATFVTLNIFDVLGRHISTIVNEQKSAGTYQANVYLPNLPSGVYFYRIYAHDYVKTKKFILLR